MKINLSVELDTENPQDEQNMQQILNVLDELKSVLLEQ
jgi:hypothetical protein